MSLKPKFYEYHQNNSGGAFHEDENVGYAVLIEAYSAEQANSIAQTKGIYFNGASEDEEEGGGRDCPCCGDRWSPTDESDATDTPSVYGKELPHAIEKNSFGYWGLPVVVHYLDSSKKYFDDQGGEFTSYEDIKNGRANQAA